MIADISVTDVMESTEVDISRVLSTLSILSDYLYRYYENDVDIMEYMKALDLVVGVLADDRKRLNKAIEKTTIVQSEFIQHENGGVHYEQN